MKLLFDENLSRHLVGELIGLFPESTHVVLVDLEGADDSDVWRFAAEGDFVLVSKDSDFHERSSLVGHPPKVVWIRRGNCTTREICELLRTSHPDLIAFESDSSSFLVLD